MKKIIKFAQIKKEGSPTSLKATPFRRREDGI